MHPRSLQSPDPGSRFCLRSYTILEKLHKPDCNCRRSLAMSAARGNRLKLGFRNDLLMQAAWESHLPGLERQHCQEESGEAESGRKC